MRQTQIIMDMPITLESDAPSLHARVFDYFRWVDHVFSPFKKTSDISKINKGQKVTRNEVKEVLLLSNKTCEETQGFFDIRTNSGINPCGIVKGWAIHNAAQLFTSHGVQRYYVEAGGDIEVAGSWTIGIRNPFNKDEIVKTVRLTNQGIATSGTYERGHHILNPKTKKSVDDIVSLSVVGLDAYEADRFATAAFAMGKPGIAFIAQQKNLNGYMIDPLGIATYTNGFTSYEVH